MSFFFSAASAQLQEAMGQSLQLQSGALGVEHCLQCRQAVGRLMAAQNISDKPAALRGASDAELVRMAMLAAVAGISEWKRSPEGRILISEQGALQPLHHVDAIHIDVLLGIICTLLAVIVATHVLEKK